MPYFEESTMDDVVIAIEELQTPVPVPELSHIQNMNVNLKARELLSGVRSTTNLATGSLA